MIVMEGQMWKCERELLHEVVCELQPEFAFEVGTWKGGGSTLQIVTALEKHRRGKLFTSEVNYDFHTTAIRNFGDHPHLLPFVEFFHGKAEDVLLPVLEAVGRCDFAFLDGSEDDAETMAQLEMFTRFATPTTIFGAHDWGTSNKCKQVKPLVESSDRYEIVQQIKPHGHTFEDGSVGLCFWKLKS